jgi:hypothetical protein
LVRIREVSLVKRVIRRELRRWYGALIRVRENMPKSTSGKTARKQKTFHECAEAVPKCAELKKKACRTVVLSLETYAYPVIGRKRVGEITKTDLLSILEPIWKANSVQKRKRQPRAWSY